MGFFTKEVIKNVIPSGYIHESQVRDLEKNPYTEDEVLAMAAEILRPLYGENIEKGEERKLFDKLLEVEGLGEYLRLTMARDLQRHFVAATPIEQMNIRGAFSRTLYLKSLLTKKTSKELKGPRYAK